MASADREVGISQVRAAGGTCAAPDVLESGRAVASCDVGRRAQHSAARIGPNWGNPGEGLKRTRETRSIRSTTAAEQLKHLKRGLEAIEKEMPVKLKDR